MTKITRYCSVCKRTTKHEMSEGATPTFRCLSDHRPTHSASFSSESGARGFAATLRVNGAGSVRVSQNPRGGWWTFWKE